MREANIAPLPVDGLGRKLRSDPADGPAARFGSRARSGAPEHSVRGSIWTVGGGGRNRTGVHGFAGRWQTIQFMGLRVFATRRPPRRSPLLHSSAFEAGESRGQVMDLLHDYPRPLAREIRVRFEAPDRKSHGGVVEARHDGRRTHGTLQASTLSSPRGCHVRWRLLRRRHASTSAVHAASFLVARLILISTSLPSARAALISVSN